MRPACLAVIAAVCAVGNAAKIRAVEDQKCYGSPEYDASSDSWSVSLTPCADLSEQTNADSIFLTTRDGKALSAHLDSAAETITLTEADAYNHDQRRLSRRQFFGSAVCYGYDQWGQVVQTACAAPTVPQPVQPVQQVQPSQPISSQAEPQSQDSSDSDNESDSNSASGSDDSSGSGDRQSGLTCESWTGDCGAGDFTDKPGTKCNGYKDCRAKCCDFSGSGSGSVGRSQRTCNSFVDNAGCRAGSVPIKGLGRPCDRWSDRACQRVCCVKPPSATQACESWRNGGGNCRGGMEFLDISEGASCRSDGFNCQTNCCRDRRSQNKQDNGYTCHDWKERGGSCSGGRVLVPLINCIPSTTVRGCSEGLCCSLD